MENMGSVEAAFKHPRWTHWCSTITIYHITVREQQGFERRREKYEKYFLRCPDRFVQRSKLPDRQCISLSAVWFPAYVPALLSSGRLVRVCFCEYLLSLVCLVNQSCSALLAGLFGESLIVFVTEAAALSESLSLYRVQLFYTLLYSFHTITRTSLFKMAWHLITVDSQRYQPGCLQPTFRHCNYLAHLDTTECSISEPKQKPEYLKKEKVSVSLMSIALMRATSFFWPVTA